MRYSYDALEHYASCLVVRGFARHFLRLDFAASRGIELFTLAAPELDDRGLLVRCGVLIYAVWRHVESTHRHGPPAGDRASGHQRALQQAAREAVRGHMGARRALDHMENGYVVRAAELGEPQ